jgi:hypothetical protein
MLTDMQDTPEQDCRNRQAALAAALLAGVFMFGQYFGGFASIVMILVALILLSGYPVLGVPLWLWMILAGWLYFRK